MYASRRGPALLLILIIFWLLFVLGGYYYYHKPIRPDMLAAPLQAALDLVIAALFAGLAGAIGLRLVPAKQVPPLERAVMQFAFGAGLIGLAWLGLGALKLYRFPISWPLLALGLLLLRHEARAWYLQLGEIAVFWRQAGRLEKALAFICGWLVLYQLLISLAPPLKWDALSYHLQLPRQYLAAGGVVFIPENPYWGHPQLAEMVFTLGMALHRMETAAVLSWGAGVFFLIGLLGLTGSLFKQLSLSDPTQKTTSSGADAGWGAVTAVMAGLTFRSLLGWTYSETFGALFGLAGLTAFLSWLQNRQARWFVLACLLSGMAIGTKWTAGVLTLGFFLSAVLACRPVHQNWRELFFRLLLPGGLAVLLVTAPWLIKNTLATGSPTYPYFFPTTWIDAARMESTRYPRPPIEWGLRIFLPITTTWTAVDSAQGFSADPGPLLLLLALPGFWRFRRSLAVQSIGLMLLVASMAIAVASIPFGELLQTRLYAALLGGVGVLAGLGWAWLSGLALEGVRLRRVIGATLLLVMGLALWQDLRLDGRVYARARHTRKHIAAGIPGKRIGRVCRGNAAPGTDAHQLVHAAALGATWVICTTQYAGRPVD